MTSRKNPDWENKQKRNKKNQGGENEGAKGTTHPLNRTTPPPGRRSPLRRRRGLRRPPCPRGWCRRGGAGATDFVASQLVRQGALRGGCRSMPLWLPRLCAWRFCLGQSEGKWRFAFRMRHGRCEWPTRKTAGAHRRVCPRGSRTVFSSAAAWRTTCLPAALRTTSPAASGRTPLFAFRSAHNRAP